MTSDAAVPFAAHNCREHHATNTSFGGTASGFGSYFSQVGTISISIIISIGNITIILIIIIIGNNYVAISVEVLPTGPTDIRGTRQRVLVFDSARSPPVDFLQHR